MANRLGKRVIHFANMPFKLLMPSSFTNITEFAVKTIPSASKIEIKRVMEKLYGFEVDEVRTLNMNGKKKQIGGILLSKPQYKKAYIMLKHPLSISPELFPIKEIEEDKRVRAKELKSKSGTVENEDSEGGRRSHWLDEKVRPDGKVRESKSVRRSKGARGTRGGGLDRSPPREAEKFPWRIPCGGGRSPSRGGGGTPPEMPERKFPWSSLKRAV